MVGGGSGSGSGGGGGGGGDVEVFLFCFGFVKRRLGRKTRLSRTTWRRWMCGSDHSENLFRRHHVGPSHLSRSPLVSTFVREPFAQWNIVPHRWRRRCQSLPSPEAHRWPLAARAAGKEGSQRPSIPAQPARPKAPQSRARARPLTKASPPARAPTTRPLASAAFQFQRQDMHHYHYHCSHNHHPHPLTHLPKMLAREPHHNHHHHDHEDKLHRHHEHPP